MWHGDVSCFSLVRKSGAQSSPTECHSGQGGKPAAAKSTSIDDRRVSGGFERSPMDRRFRR